VLRSSRAQRQPCSPCQARLIRALGMHLTLLLPLIQFGTWPSSWLRRCRSASPLPCPTAQLSVLRSLPVFFTTPSAPRMHVHDWMHTSLYPLCPRRRIMRAHHHPWPCWPGTRQPLPCSPLLCPHTAAPPTSSKRRCVLTLVACSCSVELRFLSFRPHHRS